MVGLAELLGDDDAHQGTHVGIVGRGRHGIVRGM
jgi:hypothetical protein